MSNSLFEIIGLLVLAATGFSVCRRILSLQSSQRGLLMGAWLVILGLIPLAWREHNILLQWVWIEGTTLAGALLIASAQSRKAVEAAWKFLLINSLGLGVALFGLILIIFGVGKGVALDVESIRQAVISNPNWVVETGLWLTIYGYSAKLGLFPNHFWVNDTYSESPSSVAALLSGFLPILIAVPLLNFVDIDMLAFPHRVSAGQGLIVMSVLTLIYSVFTLKQVANLRSLSALTAMFHGGMFGVFIYLDPSPELFRYIAAGILLFKVTLFWAADFVKPSQIRRGSIVVFVLVFLAGFSLPASPFFVTDLVLVKYALASDRWWLMLLPVCGIIFVCVGLSRILPTLEHHRVSTSGRRGYLWVTTGFVAILALGVYGYVFWDSLGGLGHA